MNNDDKNSNSCVDIPSAPEWLSKLENSREKLQASRLGHEAGAGAPCRICENKCPGLDLHFWRKICRNCKCRKDQHQLSDNDYTGWAQFEILGQIRSKPAFIKIKSLAGEAISLEWVPPNAAPDIISDYMEKIGIARIPVAKSDAAYKRKQQLEFQVPPHDLDANLCDKLSESEAKQLQQYVLKIRNQCVGQGKVVRVKQLEYINNGNMLQQGSSKQNPTQGQSYATTELATDNATNNPVASGYDAQFNFGGMKASIDNIEKLELPSKTGNINANTPVTTKPYQCISSKEYNEKCAMTSCHDCSKPFKIGDVVVKTDRDKREFYWHPECFKCHSCRELLADLVYFLHGNQVYCGRDLAIKLQIPRCKACDELIFTREYTGAEGSTFHLKHFCCTHCDKPLAGMQYVPDQKTNMPLCLKCYDEFFAEVCQKCLQTIGPTDQGVGWGEAHWHKACFICAGVDCGKSLIGGRLCLKQNMPFCSTECIRSRIK